MRQLSMCVGLALAALLLVPGPADARQVRAKQGRSLRRPAPTLRVSGARLVAAEGDRFAAWVRLSKRPGRVAAVVHRGDGRLALQLFEKIDRSWVPGPYSVDPVAVSGDVDPKPRVARVGDSLVLLTTRTATPCRSGQDACPPVDRGALFDVSGTTPKRLAAFPFEVYTGEEPSVAGLRHQLFAFEPRFEDVDGDGLLDVRLLPAGWRVVKERRGTHVVTRRRVRKRSKYPVEFRRTNDGFDAVYTSIGAWARGPLDELGDAPSPRRAARALREVVGRLEWAYAMHRLEDGDDGASPRGFHLGFACLVADVTGGGPSCPTDGLPVPVLSAAELPAVARHARVALLQLPRARRDKRLITRLSEMIAAR